MLSRLNFVKSTDATTSSGVHPTKISPKFRQGSAVVDNSIETGSPSWLLVHGSSVFLEFSISKYKNKRSKTCLILD